MTETEDKATKPDGTALEASDGAAELAAGSARKAEAPSIPGVPNVPKEPKFNFEAGPSNDVSAAATEAGASTEAAADLADESPEGAKANAAGATRGEGFFSVEVTDENGETSVVDLKDAIKSEAKDTMANTGSRVGIAVAVVAALLIGLLVGAFVINGGGQQGAGSLAGKTKVTEQELGSAIGSFTLDGKTETITVKEAIEQNGSLEAVKDESGNYAMPSADAVLTAARNKVLVADAAAKGIQVTDEEVAAYAQQQLGSSDFESIGASYGMDAQSVKNLLHDSALMNKLSESVAGDSNATTATPPELPTEPQASTSSSSSADSGDGSEDAAAGEESTAASTSAVSKEYADYIIALAGDEWDKTKGTWASTSGPYYQALSSYEITPEGASYEAAMAAYYVAYQAYSQEASATANVWTDYVNGLLAKASITIYTLTA